MCDIHLVVPWYCVVTEKDTSFWPSCKFRFFCKIQLQELCNLMELLFMKLITYCKSYKFTRFFKLKQNNVIFTICSDERRRDFLNFSLEGVTSIGLLLDRLLGVRFAGWPLGSESSVSRSSQEVSFPSLFRLKKKHWSEVSHKTKTTTFLLVQRKQYLMLRKIQGLWKIWEMFIHIMDIVFILEYVR